MALDFERELRDIQQWYHQKPDTFGTSNSKGVRKGANLSCKLSSLATVSKNEMLVWLKNVQKTWKVGKMQYINVHFPGDHYIQTNFTFWCRTVKLLNLHERATHFLNTNEWRILEQASFWSYHYCASHDLPLKSSAINLNKWRKYILVATQNIYNRTYSLV